MSNKIAIVTGGSRGLGKNMALHLAKKGIDVILTYNSKLAEANEVVKKIEQSGGKAVALQLNVGDSKSFAAFTEQVKAALKTTWNAERFDFLVNNAGVGIHASFAETTEEQFDQLLNIHLKGTFFLTQKLLPVINDGGIETLTKYMAKELGARGIAVNVVAPGAIETDFGGGAVRDNAQLNQFVAAQTALGRAGLPDDIGGVIASLLSEDNRWVNGQRIEASGGMFL